MVQDATHRMVVSDLREQEYQETNQSVHYEKQEVFEREFPPQDY
jgi:hypothetical protein